MGVGLAALNRLAGVAVIDRLKLRKPLERAVYEAQQGRLPRRRRGEPALRRRAASAASRSGRAPRPARDLFDLTPTDEQKMIVDATREFAAEQLRPVAAAADDRVRGAGRESSSASVTELGVTLVGVPEIARRHGQRALGHHRRPRRRGARARRHGPGRRLPGPGRREQRARAVGRRDAAGHLPAGVRRRRRARPPRSPCSSRARCSTRSRCETTATPHAAAASCSTA